MSSENKEIDRRTAVSRVGMLGVGAIISAAVTAPTSSADAQAKKIATARNSTWFERVMKDRRLLVPYFRAIANAIERDSSEPLNAYRKMNPDYPQDQPASVKICWACLGRVLVAVGEWLQKI